MKVIVDLQNFSASLEIPEQSDFVAWASAALQGEFDQVELTIRLVDRAEITKLNETYRRKKGPTNVLAFPFEQPTDIEMDVPLLGDIVICVPVLIEEAVEQKKPLAFHWAHLVVHACLHLLGLDHQNIEEARCMEAKEVEILNTLGFPNPYEESALHE